MRRYACEEASEVIQLKLLALLPVYRVNRVVMARLSSDLLTAAPLMVYNSGDGHLISDNQKVLYIEGQQNHNRISENGLC